MKKIYKPISIAFITLSLILITPIVLVNIPFVQQKGVLYISKALKKNGVDISFDEVDVIFPLSLSIKKISAKMSDESKYEIKKIFLSPNLLSLLYFSPRIKNLSIDSISITLSKKNISQEQTEQNIISELQGYLLILKEHYIQDAKISNISVDGVDEKFSFILESNKGDSDFFIYKNEKDLLAKVNFFNTGFRKGRVDFYFSNFDKIEVIQDYFSFFRERNLSLKEVSGSIDFLVSKRFVDFTLNSSFVCDKGNIKLLCALSKANNFKFEVVNNSAINIPLFAQFKKAQFKAEKNTKNNWIVCDSNIEGSEASLDISGEIIDINQLFCGAFDKLKADLCFSFSGNFVKQYFLEPIFNIKLLFGGENDIAFDILASSKDLRSNFLKTILSKKINIKFKNESNNFLLDINCIKGNNFTVKTDKDFKKTHITINKKVDKALLDESEISLVKNGNIYELNGSINPIGNNIIKFDSKFCSDQSKILNGIVTIDFKDLAPLTTPFDFATVGNLSGDIRFSGFSLINKTGKAKIDLNSKYFRSPIFKTEESSIIGSVNGELSPDLRLKVSTLAIGKNFLAEKTEAILSRKKDFNNLTLTSSSYKKGYLSTNLDIKVDVDYFDGDKKYFRFNEFLINHLNQKVRIKNSFDVFIDQFFIKKAEVLINNGVIDISNIFLPNNNSDKWTGRVDIKHLPVGIINWFIPKTLMVGSLNGQIDFKGVAERPDIKMNLKGKKLHWRKLHTELSLKEAFLDFDINTHLLNKILNYDISFGGEKIANCSLKGSFPVNKEHTGALSGKYKGVINLSLVSAIIATGDRLSGDINFDLDLSGTLSEPFWKGYISTNNSYVELAEFGTIINEIKGKIIADGKKWIVQNLTAIDKPLISKPNKKRRSGNLSFQGVFDFKTIYNPLIDISLKLSDYTVVHTDAIKGRVNSLLKVSGEGIYSQVSGEVDIQDFSIDLDHLDTDDSIPTIDLRDPRKRKFAKEYQKENIKIQNERAILPLNLNLKTNGKFKLFGSVLQDSLWGGEVTVLGPIADPYLKGSVSVLKGAILLFGKTLVISSGKVSFSEHDQNEPWFSLQAVRKTADVKIQVNIDNKQDPVIRFDSSPSKPENDIISHLLFGKGTSTMSPGESIQLAVALSQLQGGKVSGVLTGFRKSLWFDTIELRQEQDEKSSNIDKKSQQVVHLGKKLSESTELSLQHGADSSSLGIEAELGRNITVDASYANKSDDNSNIGRSTGAGITWSKRY